MMKICKTCGRKTRSKYDSCSYCYSKNQKLKTIESVFRDTFSNNNKRYIGTWEIETTEKILDFLKGKCKLSLDSIDRNLFNFNIQLDLKLIIRDLSPKEYKELLDVIKNDN